MILQIVIIALLLLTACKQPKQEQPRTSARSIPTVVAAARDTRPVIVAFGDSFTAGFGVE
jgi:uncharacterized lipoprotein YajG